VQLNPPMPDRRLPYRVETADGSFVVRCEVLTLALREAEKMAHMTQTEVRVYHEEKVVQTVRAAT
jgi:hypothetical protein